MMRRVSKITLRCLLCVLLLGAGAARAQGRPASLDDVVLLAQSGLSDDTILSFLETRSIGFVLSAASIVQLRAAGVSEVIIRYLLKRFGVASVPQPVYTAPIWPGSAYPVSYYAASYAPVTAVVLGGTIFPHWFHDDHIVAGHLVASLHVDQLHPRPGHHGVALAGSHRFGGQALARPSNVTVLSHPAGGLRHDTGGLATHRAPTVHLVGGAMGHSGTGHAGIGFAARGHASPRSVGVVPGGLARPSGSGPNWWGNRYSSSPHPVGVVPGGLARPSGSGPNWWGDAQKR